MKKILILVITLSTYSLVNASPANNELGLDIGNAHPFLNNGMKIDGYDYLEATLDVQKEGASVSWAPLLNNTRKYNAWFSETRFQVSQADDVTSLGLSFKYNPLSPRSSRGMTLFTPKQTDPYGINARKNHRVTLLEEKIIDIYTDTKFTQCNTSAKFINALLTQLPPNAIPNPIPPRLINTSKCTWKKLKTDIDQLPAQISNTPSAQKPTLEAKLKRLNKALKPISEFVKLSYWENLPISNNQGNLVYSEIVAIENEIATLKAQVSASQKAIANGSYLSYKESLQRISLPVITVSYISSYFKVIGGDRIDSDNNGLDDNGHNNKSTVISIAADWRLNENNALALLYSRSKEREKAETGSVKVSYEGFGITWLHKLVTLNKGKYKSTDDYKESLFEPSINFGLAYEEKKCKSGPSDCIDGIVKSRSITPFFDFKISKAAQFRLGVPFVKNKNFMTNESEDSIEVIASINFQLGAPK